MTNRNNAASVNSSTLGGMAIAWIVFVFTLLGFVAESQLTQYVQSTLGYRHPYFLFYLVHASFIIIFPVHLLYLRVWYGHPISSLLKGLSFAVTKHFSPSTSPSTFDFPRNRFLQLVAIATIGVTYPALLWFAAITLASVTDVTAIWNANAFFAYIITVKIFRLKWEPIKLAAVCLATVGVLAVTYGGSTVSPPPGQLSSQAGRYLPRTSADKPSAPLIGDLLTLIASIGYGLYQVLYKKYVALPSDPEVTSEAIHYAQVSEDVEEDAQDDGDDELLLAKAPPDMVYPLPWGLHPNMFACAIGLCTLLFGWIPLPFLHFIGVEPFALPADAHTWSAIVGIALTGVVFNCGFMILLGVWGPIIVSVGNLLTIVLVLISDIIFGKGLEVLTAWSMIGSGVIVAAFGILSYDIFRR